MASKAEQIVEERRETDKDISSDKTKLRYVFNFSWTAPRGEKYEGTFVNRILSTGDKADVEVMATQFLGGVPWDSVRPERRDMETAKAHMQISLEQEGRPSWAKNLQAIIDEDVIVLLHKEVDSHEVTFRRPKKDTPRSDVNGRVQEGNQNS